MSIRIGWWMAMLMGVLWGTPCWASFEKWDNQITQIKPNVLEIGSGRFVPSDNRVSYNVWAVKLDMTTPRLYINWVENSTFTGQLGGILMAVNGPLYVGNRGLIFYHQEDAVTRMTGTDITFSHQNVHVYNSINWYEQNRLSGATVLGSISINLNPSSNLTAGFYQWQTLVQAFGPSPREAFSAFNPDPGPRYMSDSFRLGFNVPAQTQKRNLKSLRLLSGGTTYVVKNLHLVDTGSRSNYTVITGPYRTDAIMADSLPSSIIGFSDVPVSKNAGTLVSIARDEWVVSNPNTYFKVGSSGMGFPTGIMFGGSVANSGITVDGPVLITGQFGGEVVAESSNRINWNNGAFQEIEVGSAGKLIQFTDPVFGQMGVLPTTLYLFVKRTGAGRLSFEGRVRWPVATPDRTDTRLYRSYDIDSELDQINWSEVEVNSPLYELFTFIFDGQFYLAASSGLYNTKDNGNGRWF